MQKDVKVWTYYNNVKSASFFPMGNITILTENTLSDYGQQSHNTVTNGRDKTEYQLTDG